MAFADRREREECHMPLPHLEFATGEQSEGGTRSHGHWWATLANNLIPAPQHSLISLGLFDCPRGTSGQWRTFSWSIVMIMHEIVIIAT